MFWFLAKPDDQMKSLVGMMGDLKKQGKINDSVALFVVQLPFGQEYSSTLKQLLASAGFKIVYDTAYPFRADGSVDANQGGQGGQSRHHDCSVLSARHSSC